VATWRGEAVRAEGGHELRDQEQREEGEEAVTKQIRGEQIQALVEEFSYGTPIDIAARCRLCGFQAQGVTVDELAVIMNQHAADEHPDMDNTIAGVTIRT
jgi:hypothetical protein